MSQPVVGESGTPGMLFAERDLLVVEVQFGAVAPLDHHRVSPSRRLLAAFPYLFFTSPAKAVAPGRALERRASR